MCPFLLIDSLLPTCLFVPIIWSPFISLFSLHSSFPPLFPFPFSFSSFSPLPPPFLTALHPHCQPRGRRSMWKSLHTKRLELDRGIDCHTVTETDYLDGLIDRHGECSVHIYPHKDHGRNTIIHYKFLPLHNGR